MEQSLAESASWTRRFACSTRWNPGRPRLAELVERTGLARPTAHRIAVRWSGHRLVGRDAARPVRARPAPRRARRPRHGEDRLLAAARAGAGPAQGRDRRRARSSTVRTGDTRRCVAAAERASGLRDTVPVGAVAADDRRLGRAGAAGLGDAGPVPPGAAARRKFTAATLTQVRRRGWAASVAEREAGVASVSAPVRGPGGRVIAAVSVSGPIERLTRSPGRLHAPVVARAGEKITELLRRAGGPRPGSGGPRLAGRLTTARD